MNDGSGKSKLMTASELAQLLNVHINTVRRWTNRGLISTYRIGPRGDRRFTKESVDEFMAKTQNTSELFHTKN